MQEIYMLDEYRHISEKALCIGKYEAYKEYTNKYKPFFSRVFSLLYHCKLSDIRYMVESVDFDGLSKIVERNITNGMREYVRLL